MIDLGPLNGIVGSKKFARIEQALAAHHSPVIAQDTHIATAIAKGVLQEKIKRSGEIYSGYAELYREKRKGQQFVGGRQIKFYGTMSSKLHKQVDKINRVYDLLGINAQAELVPINEYWSAPSVAIFKKEY